MGIISEMWEESVSALEEEIKVLKARNERLDFLLASALGVGEMRRKELEAAKVQIGRLYDAVELLQNGEHHPNCANQDRCEIEDQIDDLLEYKPV